MPQPASSRAAIRPARPDDAAVVLALAARSAVETGAAPPRLSRETWRADGFGDAPAFRCFLAEQAGAVVGYALCCRDYDTDRMVPAVTLADLFVAPEARRRGLGTDLLAATVAAGHGWGARLATWLMPSGDAGGRAFAARFAQEDAELIFCAAADTQFAALAASTPQPGHGIRTATVQDASVLAGFVGALLEALGGPPPPGVAAAMLADGFGPDPAFACVIADSPEGPAGYALFWPFYAPSLGGRGALLSDLYVAPAARRRGLALALLQAVARAGAAQGDRHLVWQVLRRNAAARALYRRVAREQQDLRVWLCEGAALAGLRSRAASLVATSAQPS